MKSVFLNIIAATFLLPASISAQKALVPSSRYINGLSSDTLYIVTGTTYLFDVDTPENEGLKSTTPTVGDLVSDLSRQAPGYSILTPAGIPKKEGLIATGDRLLVRSKGRSLKQYPIALRRSALKGILEIEQPRRTVGTQRDLVINYTVGQRSPNATIVITLPADFKADPGNTFINIIGRGEVLLQKLEQQSIGRTGSNYSYNKTGHAQFSKDGKQITLTGLDLRPSNGVDVKIRIRGAGFSKTGVHGFTAYYTTREPETLRSAESNALVTVTQAISDLQRIPDSSTYQADMPDRYSYTTLKWPRVSASSIIIQQSTNGGKSWTTSDASVDMINGIGQIKGLQTGRLYKFRILVSGGKHQGASNVVSFFSGKPDIKQFGVSGKGDTDDTEKINAAIDSIYRLGGGTLLFTTGTYNVRTVHLKSNVWLYLEKDATIQALKGGDAPELTWFSSKKYRSGLSPTDMGPYAHPENWLTKQDVGHAYFRNAMFTAVREDNIKITGNGYITGNGNLVTSDKVMDNKPDNRNDKMFSLKLCSRIEIGGIYRKEDLWYDSTSDAPYYITPNKGRDFNTDNMLKIDRAGHFVLLATGTDGINVHDTYFAKDNSSNARDIYDFMGCNDVYVRNIYSKVSSDDIVKPGSDCSLGFTRPAKNYKIRNIIGDTNCNLFQIGSETADDITNICVDNIYVLGANKAGFSISTNDGGLVRDIHLNCGETGPLHNRSKMLRTHTPFFISISNRGRVLGAEARLFKFTENGTTRNELLVTNVNIGRVENITLNGIDISEVYAGSSYGKANKRWPEFDGNQRTASPIVAGYALPASSHVEGGLTFRLPNGIHTGYITNISFNDIHLLVKGGHPVSDTAANPPELGVGQYNVSNLKIQPSWGLWARHIKDLAITNSTFNYEQPDHRYWLFLNDAQNVRLSNNRVTGSAIIGQKETTGLQ
ncbi:endopygalactorunase [Niabella sp. 22666]|uniref:endopygalactorunase n=1 Tax=Niabella sp. 22666 TaxID=3453954 RepID=UPI003F839355